jgi:hypothetical protein
LFVDSTIIWPLVRHPLADQRLAVLIDGLAHGAIPGGAPVHPR